jgi:hypothetical protein
MALSREVIAMTVTEQCGPPGFFCSSLRPNLLQHEPDRMALRDLIPVGLRASKITKAAATTLYQIVSAGLNIGIDKNLDRREQDVLVDASSLMYTAFPHALSIIDRYSKDDRDELVSDIESLMLEAYVLGAVGLQSPIFERLHKEKQKAQVRPAQEKRSIPPSKRRLILARHAQELWEKNALRNGNASGTAQAILESVNRDLLAHDLRPVSERTIRRDLPKIASWQPRSTTRHE